MKNHSSQSDHSTSPAKPILNNEISLPLLHARDLNGKDCTLPHDLPAKKTLLFFAFKRRQQSSIDSWIDSLGLRSSENKITWFEVPILKNSWKLLRSWIHNGMKRGITDHESREHVWTIYTNRRLFLKTMKLKSANSIYAFVVTQDGRVVSSVSGDYSTTTAEIILKALHD